MHRRPSVDRGITAPRWLGAVALALMISAPIAHAAPTDWEGTRPIVPAALAPAPHALAMPTSMVRGGRALGGPADGEWQRIAPPAGSDRLQAAVIYDPVANRLLSFAGDDGSFQYTNTLYAFVISTGTWSTVATQGTPPPARRLHRAIYDSAQKRMIVYGGWADSTLGDVWQLSLSGGTPTWTQIIASGGPSRRAASGVIYDAAGQRMIVFGGYTGDTATAGRSNEVWALSLGTTPAWSQLHPSGDAPSPRSSMSAVYDPSGPAMLVFGGSDPEFKNEVWRLSLDAAPAWTLLTPGGAAPAPREEQVAQFDPASHRMVVFGGYDAYALYNDLWILDFSGATPAWSQASPLPPIAARWGAGSAIASNGTLYVTAGYSPCELLADVWSVSVANPNAWQTYEVLLPPRLQEVMVLDTQRDRLIAFGGTDGQYRNDTYTHSMVFGDGWDPLATAGPLPAARRLHTGIYDPVGDRMVVFGGYDDQLLGDLWQLSFSGATPTWSQINAPGGPSPRGGHMAIYDPVGQRMIVFGGYDGVTPPANRTGDTWALSLTGTPAWTQLATGPGPSARSSATAVYDAQHHAMLVFGGTDPSYKNDTWSLSLDDPPTWSLISPTGTFPGPREEQSAVYDGKRDRMVIFGGYNSSLTNYGDLKSLDLGDAPAWSPLAPDGTPPSARWGMKAIYDSNRDGMWLYGGWDYTYEHDLWLLQWFDPVTATVATNSATLSNNVAHLEWTLPGSVPNLARVERSADGANWTTIGSVLPTKTGHVAFDNSIAPGQARAYRVRVAVGGNTYVSTPRWVSNGSTAVGEGTVAFGIRPAGRASSPGAVVVSCTLPREGRAHVELLDVAGRLLDARSFAGIAGNQRFELGHGLKAGLYFARLTANAGVAKTRVLLLP